MGFIDIDRKLTSSASASNSSRFPGLRVQVSKIKRGARGGLRSKDRRSQSESRSCFPEKKQHQQVADNPLLQASSTGSQDTGYRIQE